MAHEHDDTLKRAAEAIAAADALLICAGAGMGVDSGLPDFRGAKGFWKAYPAYEHLGLSFVNMANPQGFRRDPPLSWGFYGHRLGLYRETVPHEGFAALLRMAGAKPRHVFTSNVDGQFQKAGFEGEDVFEVHGSIHWLQCTKPCGDAIWDARDTEVAIDEASFRAQGELPRCPACQAIARPNILMFGDWGFVGERCHGQGRRYQAWLDALKPGGLVVIEMGAGTSISTVRDESERLLARGLASSLVRINPREPHGPSGTISLPMGALEALSHIERNM